jgi:hypothetical protein
MFANRVKETTTTTGTGNLTLAGAATNFETFNTAFGTIRKFCYWIVDSTNNVWETGIGYLSASTTLVRETVLDNSSGTTAALTLSAGTKTVMASPSEAILPQTCPFLRNDSTAGKIISSAHHLATASASYTLTANQLVLFPAYFDVAGSLTNFVLNVSTAVAASKARVGLYEIDTDGEPGELIVQSADIDTTTTGVKTPTIASLVWAPRWCYVGVIANAAVGLYAYGKRLSNGPVGLNAYHEHTPWIYDDVTAGWSVLPNPPVIDGRVSSYIDTPMIMLKAA